MNFSASALTRNTVLLIINSSMILSLNPKVSGAIKLEGIAQDNSLLKSLSVDIDGTSYGIASYADGSWTVYNGAGWSAEIRQATYAEIKAAGYSENVYHFEVPIMSEDSIRQTLDSTYTLKIKDLVLFK